MATVDGAQIHFVQVVGSEDVPLPQGITILCTLAGSSAGICPTPLGMVQFGLCATSASKCKLYLLQAHVILSVAKDKGGKYYQRKKPSDFGRTYYAGTSVQNVNKELRRAMLGNCWEYNIRSSVVAWKMGFATGIHHAALP